jgi:hypothetical protein
MGFHCAGKSCQVVVAAITAVGRSVTMVTVTAGLTDASTRADLVLRDT